jgi:hypothetical protein
VLRSVVLFVAGATMLASAGAHALLGWPGLNTALQQTNVPADLVTGLAIGWYFGSASLLAFGLIVLVAARRVWRGDKTVGAYLWPIVILYLLFGLAALVATGFNPFFLLFVGTGVLTAVPLFGLVPR